MANLKLKIAVILFTLLYFFSSTAAPVLAAISYLYDQNGNMTSDGTKCYEYNEANQQKRVKNCSNNQTIAEYVYDYQGNRLVKKTYSSGVLQKTTFSPNDGYETVKLASNSATQNTSYYFVNDQLIAKKNSDGSKNYYHNDHLGSTSIMTSQTGTLVEETKYDPWGEVKTGGTKSKFLFTGQEKDLETNLNYYNARYYDSHIRRFTQPDDIIQNVYDPQSLNRYSYVRNNPLRYTDPSGNCIGPLLIVCVAGIALAPVIMANINPIIATVSQAASNVRKNPSPGNIVLTAADLGSNFVPGGKTAGTMVKSAGKIVSNAPEVKNTVKAVTNVASKSMASGLGNIGGGKTTANILLRNAERWLGKSYKELNEGVFRSADNTRQFRMTSASDLVDKNSSHAHFEAIGKDGREIIENSHVSILDP